MENNPAYVVPAKSDETPKASSRLASAIPEEDSAGDI